MRKRWLVGDGAAALCLGLVYPAVSASASGTAVGPSAGSASNPARIDIITKATAIKQHRGHRPRGLQLRKPVRFLRRCLLCQRSGHQGRAGGRCTLIGPSAGRFGCTIITSLPKGDITTAGPHQVTFQLIVGP
jgi:hypothetical protein